MKTFRELISWELEEEEKGNSAVHLTPEEATGKLESSILRKLHYLSNLAEDRFVSTPSAVKT